jgi:IS30 family transposase
MPGTKRIWLSPNEQSQLWSLWLKGQSLVDVGHTLQLKPDSVAAYLHRTGGFKITNQRRRSALSELEREEISRCLARGWSIREIARHLKRAPSTISREVRRNYGHSRYRARSAELRAWKSARRPKPCKLTECAQLRRVVESKLRVWWSPQQISRWLRRTFRGRVEMNVSHETIYRSLFVQARNALKKELTKHLRTGRARRRPHRETKSTATIVDGISISERPAEANDRAVPGHWEGDLLFGTVDTYIATLVERHTRYCMLVKIPSKDSKAVASAIQKQITRLPKHLLRSLTWDRGSEMAAHKQFTVETDIPVYFADPRSPWQRGSNENTNGLLRQWFPNGTDLSKYSQAQLDRYAYLLNGRPRRALDYRSPAEVLDGLLP